MKKLVIVLIVITGVGAGWWLQSSPKSSVTTNPTPSPSNSMLHSIAVTDEKVFIQEMIPHHQEAIDTSQLILTKTKDPELRKFAEQVITVQSQEVTQMKGWLKTWYNQDYTTNSDYLPMMGDLSKYQGQQLEKIYVVGMIRHHQGAIEMANKVLTLNPRPEIKKMAEEIVTVQQAEVNMLQKRLDTKYQAVEAQDDVQHQMNIH